MDNSDNCEVCEEVVRIPDYLRKSADTEEGEGKARARGTRFWEKTPCQGAEVRRLGEEEFISNYAFELRKEDEANGLFLDLDCYLLTGDPCNSTRTLLGRYWGQISGVGMALAATALNRAVNKRPLRAGLHSYFIASGLGWLGGLWMHKYKEQAVAERDAQFFHYVRLHPEDFPRKPEVLYRDYLTHWNPIR